MRCPDHIFAKLAGSGFNLWQAGLALIIQPWRAAAGDDERIGNVLRQGKHLGFFRPAVSRQGTGVALPPEIQWAGCTKDDNWHGTRCQSGPNKKAEPFKSALPPMSSPGSHRKFERPAPTPARYYLLLHLQPANPISPEPKRSRVVGSGTAGGGTERGALSNT